MSSKRQFTQNYELVVSMLKTFKSTNDRLNKSLGVEPSSTLAMRIHAQQSIHQDMQEQLQKQIAKLQESYLDPDTARKIGTLKQQFRIQKDRWAYLVQAVEMQSIRSDQNTGQQDGHPKNTVPSSKAADHYNHFNQSLARHNLSNHSTTSTTSTISMQHIYIQKQEELVGFDYEMEKKIMKQRNKEINIVASSLENAHAILKQTQSMVFQQGQNIDIIGDQIFTTLQNTRNARQNLEQANEFQKKSKKKYIAMSMFIILLVVAVILIVII